MSWLLFIANIAMHILYEMMKRMTEYKKMILFTGRYFHMNLPSGGQRSLRSFVH